MKNRWRLFTNEIYELHIPQLSVTGLKESYQLEAGSSLSIVFYLDFRFEDEAVTLLALMEHMAPHCYLECQHPLFNLSVDKHEKGIYKVQVMVCGDYLDKGMTMKEQLRVDYFGGTLQLPLNIYVSETRRYESGKSFKNRIRKRSQPQVLKKSTVCVEEAFSDSTIKKTKPKKHFWYRLLGVLTKRENDFEEEAISSVETFSEIETSVQIIPPQRQRSEEKSYLELCNNLKKAYLYSQKDDERLQLLLQKKKEIDIERKQKGERLIDASSSKALKRAEFIYKQNQQPLWLNYKNEEHIKILEYALLKKCVGELWLASIERLYLTLYKQEAFTYISAQKLYENRPCERFEKIRDERFYQLAPLLQQHLLGYPRILADEAFELTQERLEDYLYRGLFTRCEPIKTFDYYMRYLEDGIAKEEVLEAMNHYFAAQILIEDLYEFPKFMSILENTYEQSENPYPLGLALLRLYSIYGIKNTEITRKLLNKYINDGIMMSWLEPLAEELSIPYTSSQIIIDHFASKKKRVELYYRFDEEDAFQMKPMKAIVYGMYAIALNLFAYEFVDYYVKEVDSAQQHQIVKSGRLQYVPKKEEGILNTGHKRRELVETLLMCEAMVDEKGIQLLREEWIKEKDELDKVIMRK